MAGKPRQSPQRLLFVRHGVTDWNQRRLILGLTPGLELNSDGISEESQLAQALSSVPIAAVFASPLERAQQTAQIIAQKHHLSITTDVRLREVDAGPWSGLPRAKLEKDPAWIRQEGGRKWAQIPGGESLRSIKHRVREFLRDVARTHPHNTLCIVTHGDIIRAAVGCTLGLSRAELFKVMMETASVTELIFRDGLYKVVRLNWRTNGSQYRLQYDL